MKTPDPATPPPRLFANLDELIDLAIAPRNFDFRLNETDCRILIRPMNSDEAVEMEKITERIKPPKDKDGLPNDGDPDFVEQKKKAWKLRETATLDLCILSFKLVGDDLAAKAAYLAKKMPPGVTNELFSRILTITSSPIDNGLFTSSAGSNVSLPS